MNDGDVTIQSQSTKICDWRVKEKQKNAMYTLELHATAYLLQK